MRLMLLISVWALTSGFVGSLPLNAVSPGSPKAPTCQSLQHIEKAKCFKPARTVSPFSPAAKFAGAGVTLTLSNQRQVANPRLQDGDRLIKINREPIDKVSDLARLVAAASDRPLKPVDVFLTRNGDLVFLTISLDEMMEVTSSADQAGISDRVSGPSNDQSVSSALAGTGQ